MKEFYTMTGKMAIGTRLRLLSEYLTDQSAKVFKSYDTEMKPKWFPVFFTISQETALPITIIAHQIGQSHPSVSGIVKELLNAGLVEEHKDKTDGRKNLITLSKKGLALQQKLEYTYEDVGSAIEKITAHSTHQLWQALEEFEYLLEQKSLLQRVFDERKKREAANVTIVPFEDKYHVHFKRLNQEWIDKYFIMEDADHNSLDNAQEYIINRGGDIIMALHNDEVVGTCALIKTDNEEYQYELAKMAVSPKAQGLGIGWILGKEVIKIAKSKGAKNIYLESNTVLTPAITLYRKLGFKKITGIPSPYERSNIQMVLDLNT